MKYIDEIVEEIEDKEEELKSLKDTLSYENNLAILEDMYRDLYAFFDKEITDNFELDLIKCYSSGSNPVNYYIVTNFSLEDKYVNDYEDLANKANELGYCNTIKYGYTKTRTLRNIAGDLTQFTITDYKQADIPKEEIELLRALGKIETVVITEEVNDYIVCPI